MAKLYYDADADLSRLKGKKVAIIGYGSQGHAHALEPARQRRRRGGRPAGGQQEPREGAGRGAARAERAPRPPRRRDVVMILAPDTSQRGLYEELDQAAPQAGQDPDVRARLQHPLRHDRAAARRRRLAWSRPRRPATACARCSRRARGTPGLLAVHQDASGNALDNALAYAKGIGCTRAGVIETTFAEETETDLFGEQAVLCGGVVGAGQAGFETLVKAGYQPEIAYFECLHELKLIVDLMYRGGLNYMRYSVTDTAEYGDYTAGDARRDGGDAQGDGRRCSPRSRTASSRRSGSRRTSRAGRGSTERASSERSHPIEQVGKQLRAMMPFLDPVDGRRRRASSLGE